jgi:hypothetical protein
MVRTLTASAVAFTMMAASVCAAETPASGPVAPTAAVAAAWKKEAPQQSTTLRALIVTYGAAQGLDMATTIAARNRGAAEANPVMQGGYAQGMAMKAALGAATVFAVRSMGKTHRKAAIITMIAANAATAAIAAHNMQVASRLAK